MNAAKVSVHSIPSLWHFRNVVVVRCYTNLGSRPSMRVLTAIVLWIISEMAVAGPLEEANSAYDKGDFGLARNFYTDLAIQGDRMAQLRLGVLYDEGKGGANDSREATRWYIVASAQGSSEAAYNLGRLYHDGRGVPQNFARAREWYYVATERGETKAAVNLGVMDASGEGRPRDYRKAIKWFLLAAQRGDDRAKNNIGTMYFNGQGVPRDLVRSHMWYNLAAAHGDPDAIQNRASVARLMTLKQMARVQEMASDRQMYIP
jgi:TPR repeat protein